VCLPGIRRLWFHRGEAKGRMTQLSPRDVGRGPHRSQWSPSLWEAATWAIGLGGFAYALAGTLHREDIDLRTPQVLLLDSLLAGLVALGYVVYKGARVDPNRFGRCLLYGLWSAAAFTLVPIVTPQGALFQANRLTPDAPFVLLFAVIHGAIVVVLASPFAARVLIRERGAVEYDDIGLLTGATVLIFFIVAAAVRLLVEMSRS